MKPFKSLSQQVEYLEQIKGIRFKDKHQAQRALLDHNYYNIISCSKIKFAQRIIDGKHIYSNSEFSKWIEYFEIDCKISKHLMNNVITLERILNSRTAHYISELIESESLSLHDRNEIAQLIIKAPKVGKFDFSNYTGNETWRYITKMSFGSMKKLILWTYENKREVYLKITEGYDFLNVKVKSFAKYDDNKDRLDEINNIRNSIFHFTPLNIYLVYGTKKDTSRNYRIRKEATKWLAHLEKDIEIILSISEVIQNTNKFRKNKNSQQ